MKQHKIKVLSLLIASAVLYGCHDGDDSGSTESATVQAYDGPVRGMVATAACDDDTTGEYKFTDDEGNINITLPTFVNAPETCGVSFVGGANAVDMENGKSMVNVKYTSPKGLFKKGSKATASPMTTLIAKKLGNLPYDESTASEVLTALGLGEVFNNGITIEEFLNNTQASVAKLKSQTPALFSKVSATKMILSDILTAQPNADITKIAVATQKLSNIITQKYPNFPASGNKEIFINIIDIVKDSAILDKLESLTEDQIKNELADLINKIDNPETAVPPTPTDPTDPTGTGTGTGTGSTGGGTGA